MITLLPIIPHFASECMQLNQFEIDRYELPNIKSLNFYVRGLLENGVSSNNRKDGQAKSLGEYLGVKMISCPKSLLKK